VVCLWDWQWPGVGLSAGNVHRTAEVETQESFAGEAAPSVSATPLQPKLKSAGNGKGAYLKKGTSRHPKLLMFAKMLRITRRDAVGLLELLWEFTTDHAPRGDIGKWTNEAIAEAVDWKGSAEKLVEALLLCGSGRAGWLEPHIECRLLVHDWQEHAPSWLKGSLQRQGINFFSPAPPLNTQPIPNLTQPSKSDFGGIAKVTSMVIPKVEVFSLNGKFSEIWLRYPKRIGKKAAERHFNSSVKTEDDWCSISLALDHYLASDRVKNGYIQNGSTWFNDWQSWAEPTEAMMRDKQHDKEPVSKW